MSGVNWSSVGPRAVDALGDFIVWVERFKGTLSEAQSDALFDAYTKGRAVTYAVDPAADQARMASYRTPSPTTPEDEG